MKIPKQYSSFTAWYVLETVNKGGKERDERKGGKKKKRRNRRREM